MIIETAEVGTSPNREYVSVVRYVQLYTWLYDYWHGSEPPY